MSNYDIVQIDPTVAFIVTVDDEPLMNSDGQVQRHWRRVDAERAIAARQKWVEVFSQAVRRPEPPDPGMPERREPRRRKIRGRDRALPAIRH